MELDREVMSMFIKTCTGHQIVKPYHRTHMLSS